ncbi:DUF2225 domain-containing protein [Kurthia zopfii]|uniref:DUF2225 domain-containing protein n=1 Tax=Kurthia zopfii TaxID=1650 RepID=UPI000F6F7FE2|nr:DUF2225 domain-containing protein [Kurthia zopfii]VEI08682.1 Uncharacterized protein conserved in bacteria (DUF2225) [Kurthia zopfii]
MEITPYYDKQITCIHCKNNFNTTKIRKSTVKIVTSDTDFKSNYYSVNPTLYNVFVCEHCGLAFTEDFSNYFPPGTQESLQRRICDHWTKHSFNGERSLNQAIQAYQLAIICGEIKKEKHVVLAGLALRTAWLYREQEKFDWEMRFLESARDEYIECYLHGDYRGTPMTEIRVLYLIGELSRRINDEETAIKHFSKVIEKQRTTNETRIIQMTKDIWQEMRGSNNKEIS